MGAKVIVRSKPKNPVIQTSFRKTVTTTATFVSFDVADAIATFLTALVPSPKLDKPATKSDVEVNKLEIPIPVGPKSNAITFDRITNINILNIWTPPNKEVALKIFTQATFESS